eukprot:1091137_1
MTLNSHLNMVSYATIATQNIFIALSVWCMYEFIRKYIKSENRFAKALFYFGLLFFMLSTLTVLLLLIDLLLIEFRKVSAGLILSVYGFQMFFLNLILFFKVCILFGDAKVTFLQLSLTTIRTYQVAFVFQMMMIITVPLLYVLNRIHLVFALIIVLIFTSVMLTASFRRDICPQIDSISTVSHIFRQQQYACN